MLAGGTGSSAQARDEALLGTWSRTLLTTGASGFLLSSETRWTFAADGGVERRVVTYDYGFGLGDQVITTGTWTTDAGSITIRFDAPLGGSVSFAYRVTATLEGALLALDDLVFQRVTP
jgi:hypothetical protein